MTKDKKHTYAEYKELLSLPLKDKIIRAEILINHELRNKERPMIACSWGKDSMVMLHLVRKYCKRVMVVFSNTGVEYPETLVYRDKLLKEWDIKNYRETKPIKTFWECIKLYGYPKFRQMSNQGKNRTPKCCYYCKEKPAINLIKEYKPDVEFVGLQASESMVRRLSFFREGEAFDSKKYGTRIVRPLMIWTDKDIWDYHEQENIPYNPLYKKMKRNGCMPCTGFKGWKRVLANYNPDMYKFISRQIGEPSLTNWDCEARE